MTTFNHAKNSRKRISSASSSPGKTNKRRHDAMASSTSAEYSSKRQKLSTPAEESALAETSNILPPARSSKAHLQNLPVELRNMIYDAVRDEAEWDDIDGFKKPFPLLATCKAIREEATPVLHRKITLHVSMKLVKESDDDDEEEDDEDEKNIKYTVSAKFHKLTQNSLDRLPLGVFNDIKDCVIAVKKRHKWLSGIDKFKEEEWNIKWDGKSNQHLIEVPATRLCWDGIDGGWEALEPVPECWENTAMLKQVQSVLKGVDARKNEGKMTLEDITQVLNFPGNGARDDW